MIGLDAGVESSNCGGLRTLCVELWGREREIAADRLDGASERCLEALWLTGAEMTADVVEWDPEQQVYHGRRVYSLAKAVNATESYQRHEARIRAEVALAREAYAFVTALEGLTPTGTECLLGGDLRVKMAGLRRAVDRARELLLVGDEALDKEIVEDAKRAPSLTEDALVAEFASALAAGKRYDLLLVGSKSLELVAARILGSKEGLAKGLVGWAIEDAFLAPDEWMLVTSAEWERRPRYAPPTYA